MLWAVCTRVQPAEDVIAIERAASGGLDPSVPECFVSSVVGIDATRPYGKPFAEVVTIPGTEKVRTWWARKGSLGEIDKQ